MKKIGFYRYVYDFSAGKDISNINLNLNIKKYLMNEDNIVLHIKQTLIVLVLVQL